MAEYAVVLAVITVVIVGALSLLAGGIGDALTAVTEHPARRVGRLYVLSTKAPDDPSGASSGFWAPRELGVAILDTAPEGDGAARSSN